LARRCHEKSASPLVALALARYRLGMAKHIGLLMGHDTALGDALMARLGREPGIVAEPVAIGGVSERPIGRWDVIVDRFSGSVPHYRHLLKSAALAGTAVINDPFWPDDRFLALSLAARLGIAVPRAVMLPQHSYGPDVRHDASLGNLEHPLRWQTIVDYVKLPATLRYVDGSLALGSSIHDMAGLWEAFNRSGQRVTMLQQHITNARQVTVICIDFEDVIGGEELTPPLLEQTRRLSRALGYQLNAMTWALADGAGWLVDPADPQPEVVPADGHFEQIVESLALTTMRTARSTNRTLEAYHERLFAL